jgi:hypothetical protein
MIAAKLDGTTVVNVIDVGEIPDGFVACPEWVGIGMDINTPQPAPAAPIVVDPVEKLKAFLLANPDVAALLDT